MICKLLGLEHKQGNFNGIDYDKVQLYLATEINNDNGKGFRTLNTKMTGVKTINVKDVCPDVLVYSDLFNLIGKYFDVSFNEYQRLDHFILVKNKNE